MEDELITSAELAQILRTTERFVRRLVAEHRIEYVKVGRCVRFTKASVSKYLEHNTISALSRAELRRHLAGV